MRLVKLVLQSHILIGDERWVEFVHCLLPYHQINFAMQGVHTQQPSVKREAPKFKGLGEISKHIGSVDVQLSDGHLSPFHFFDSQV